MLQLQSKPHKKTTQLHSDRFTFHSWYFWMLWIILILIFQIKCTSQLWLGPLHSVDPFNRSACDRTKRNNVLCVLFFIGLGFIPRCRLVRHFHCEQVAKTIANHLPKIIYQAYLHSENSITVQHTHTTLYAFFFFGSFSCIPNGVCISYNCATKVLA